jgi:mannose-6-phosphate isomerase-like protein (cupin superfamily)
MVETLGNVWLFTLGQQTQPSRGGTKVVEVGPLAKIEAGEYLLRVNEGHGPPGGMTPVHTHPGSEAFFVLEGELNQKTAHGVSRVSAGQALAGHGADSPMQVSTSGSTNAAWFALFVLDASKPVTSPAKFD